MMPDNRWATEKEKRVWNKVKPKPTNAFKTNTATNAMDIRIKKSFSVVTPTTLHASNNCCR